MTRGANSKNRMVQELLEKLDFPVFVKPRTGREVCWSEKKFLAKMFFLESMKEEPVTIIQEFYGL